MFHFTRISKSKLLKMAAKMIVDRMQSRWVCYLLPMAPTRILPRGAEAKTQRGNIAALYKQRKLRKMVDT